MVPVLGMSPSNDALVAPAIVTRPFCALTLMVADAETAVVDASATFVEVASTVTAPAGAETDEFERTSACVEAAAVIRASATFTATEPRPPIETMMTSVVAVLWLVAETPNPAAPAVTLPSTLAVVEPATMALGTDTAAPNSAPPAPIPVVVAAVLVEFGSERDPAARA